MSIARPILRTAAALLAGICLCWNTAHGQDDAFGEPKGKTKPTAKAAAKAPGARGPAGAPANLAPPEDPVVAALLASNPTTPSEIFHTAQLLLDASRPELAKTYLRKLLDAKLDDGQWAALVDGFHSSAFTDLATRPELRPENELLIQAALGATDRRLRDPARLAEEIKQLQDPSPEVRARAIAKLKQAHAAAVDALIVVLADTKRAGEHAAVRTALAAMRGDAIDPLAEIIERADPEFAIEAIRALADMRATQAIAYLFVPALAEESDLRVREPARAAIKQLQGSLPTAAEASQRLCDLAKSYYDGKQRLTTDSHGRVMLFSWDPAAKKCVTRSCPPDDAARAFAARLARAASQLAPNNREAQTLAAATELEQMVYDRGLDKRLDFNDPEVKRLAAGDPKLIEGVMAYCLNEHHPAGARAASEILGRSGKTQETLQGGPSPSPLVRAVRSPDARLRMAALEAVANLKPKSPFPGSSFVMEALAYQAASTGGRRALVVSPGTHTLEQWIGVLKFRNIESDVATSGGDAIRTAWRCPDYELAVIDMATQSPPPEEIVQQLHQDYRTAGLRIALVARSGFLTQARRIADLDPLTLAFSMPLDAAAARWQFGQLNALVPREFVGFSERQTLAVRALDCLAKLSQTPGQLFNLQEAENAVLAGLLVPRLSGHAIVVLANIGTQDSQQALVEVASRAANPLALRKSAAVAFNLNVQQFGLLLKQDSIRQQYFRYRQSTSQDPAAQQILADVLGTIESRATPSALEAARKASRPMKAAPPRVIDPTADK
jgi:hypothetical protein